MTQPGQARASEIDGKVGEREVEIKALAQRNVPFVEAAGLGSLVEGIGVRTSEIHRLIWSKREK